MLEGHGVQPGHLHPTHGLRVQYPRPDQAGGHQLLDGRIGPIPVRLEVGPGFQRHIQEAGPPGGDGWEEDREAEREGGEESREAMEYHAGSLRRPLPRYGPGGIRERTIPLTTEASRGVPDGETAIGSGPEQKPLPHTRSHLGCQQKIPKDNLTGRQSEPDRPCERPRGRKCLTVNAQCEYLVVTWKVKGPW